MWANIESRGSKQRSIRTALQPLALGEASREIVQLSVVLGHGSTDTGRDRRAGKAQPEPPVIGDRYQHKGEQTAGQRLGIIAMPLMDATAPLGTEKDAAPVGS